MKLEPKKKGEYFTLVFDGTTYVVIHDVSPEGFFLAVKEEEYLINKIVPTEIRVYLIPNNLSAERYE